MRFKFFIPPNRTNNVFRFFHSIVVIAEGLRELGHEFYGNRDYWYENERKKYLVSEAPPDYIAEVNIYMASYFDGDRAVIADGEFKILIDAADGMFTHYNDPRFADFDLIFKAHYNSNYKYPDNVRPWAFGLSQRIIETIDQSRSGAVQDKLLVNFRGGHTLRKLVIKHFHPLLSSRFPVDDATDPKIEVPDINSISEVNDQQMSYLYQTKHRHNPNYFKRLNEARLTSVFGGFVMLKPVRGYKAGFPFLQIFKRQVLLPGMKIKADKYFIYQYDSWRLWEGLYADTIPIHLDLEEWGAQLPVMPINGQHYIGVKNFDFQSCADYILGLSKGELNDISTAGRQWVSDNYSPVNMAGYLLEEIKRISGT